VCATSYAVKGRRDLLREPNGKWKESVLFITKLKLAGYSCSCGTSFVCREQNILVARQSSGANSACCAIHLGSQGDPVGIGIAL